MIRRKKENIEWLEFEQLQEFPELTHGVFLRHGGVSKAPFNSLNCGGRNDDPQMIEGNISIVQNILGIEKLVLSNQVHGDKVLEIGDEPLGPEAGWDGLMTFKKNMALLIRHADCQATIFFDPVRKVIANVHCGWRGSVKNIYSKTVEALVRRHHCDPSNLLACISPSLGPNKAEFINHKIELPPTFLPFQVRENYFDFWEISRMQLKAAGLLDHHIEIAGICTYSEPQDFFSFRRDKTTGNNGTVIALKR